MNNIEMLLNCILKSISIDSRSFTFILEPLDRSQRIISLEHWWNLL